MSPIRAFGARALQPIRLSRFFGEKRIRVHAKSFTMFGANLNSNKKIKGHLNGDTNADTALNPNSGILEKAKSFVKFYKDGLCKLFENRTKAMKLINQNKQLTWREQQLVRTSAQDFRKLFPFGVILLILPEAIPFLVIYVPAMVPSTVIRENQLLKKRIKLQEKRDAITARAIKFSVNFPNLLTSHNFTSPEKIIDVIKTHHEHFTLDSVERKPLKAYCRFMSIPTWGPKGPLNYFYAWLASAQRGVGHLTSAELISANEERGMCTLGQTDDQLRKALTDWITVSFYKSPPAPELLLVFSRFFVNNIWTKP
ncbi:hypothetical protein L0F63_002623 [Massospora cicadina]|nr:hypothetical protein L0F63_002623 [Massospora cicadina]